MEAFDPFSDILHLSSSVNDWRLECADIVQIFLRVSDILTRLDLMVETFLWHEVASSACGSPKRHGVRA